MANTRTRTPYDGSNSKLVLAMDIGTTFSGVSYAILNPGVIPEVRTVATYPGQAKSESAAKIPSLLYYNRNGLVQAVGQEAENARESGEAEENDWILVEWFKLHLRPKDMHSSHIIDDHLPQIPANKTIINIFADFLAYLFNCTKEEIRSTFGDGILQSLEDRIDFVMGHPNGWGGLQQQSMRKAAVQAKLVPDMNAAGARIQFVTEGEASLHYCLEHGLSSGTVKPGSKIMIVDAGGGTIDLSSYLIKEVKPVEVEEIAVPGCRLQGSVFLNRRAFHFLSDKLKGSIYSDAEDIDSILRSFESNGKRKFSGPEAQVNIKFGSRNDNDPQYNISKGVLRLSGEEVLHFFDPSLDAILDAVQEQRSCGGDITKIFFVGGFAASEYLYHKLSKELKSTGSEVSRPDGFTHRAVADGAMSFYLDHVVSTRAARMTYGVKGIRSYISTDPDHISRMGSTLTKPSGIKALPNAFFCIVSKGSRVDADQEFAENFFFETTNISSIVNKRTDIITYHGSSTNPLWTDTDPVAYRTMCTITADVSQAVRSLTPVKGVDGQMYYRLDFKVVLKFGRTELQAQTAWMENGEEKRSPASIVYLQDD